MFYKSTFNIYDFIEDLMFYKFKFIRQKKGKNYGTDGPVRLCSADDCKMVVQCSREWIKCPMMLIIVYSENRSTGETLWGMN